MEVRKLYGNLFNLLNDFILNNISRFEAIECAAQLEGQSKTKRFWVGKVRLQYQLEL
jgi:hypothetical protein